MNTTEIYDLLNDEKAWLANQPSMQPWDKGCRRVVALLEDGLRRYSEQVRAAPATRADADHPVYLARLCCCLAYHWRDGAADSRNGQVDAAQVAERIAAGHGYRGGRKLGGNPLRDVVLAVAMVRKDERAPLVFHGDYYSFACALAHRVHKRLAADPDSWWNDLLDHLAGYSGGRAGLDKFDGRCALRHWLPRVVWNFLRRRPVPPGESTDVNDQPEPPAPPAPPDESMDHFREVTRLAVATLEDRGRLLLTLIFVDGLKNNEAAAVLGIHPGQASRLLNDKTLPRLQDAILEIAASRLSKPTWAGVLEDLRENPRMFAAVLREVLEEGREQP